MNLRIRHIDGLRGLAVLLVIVHHTVTHWAMLQHPAVLGRWAHLAIEGAHGVDLFFVLSGYCLSYPFLRAALYADTAPCNLASYAARRVLRIAPPYYAAIVLLALVPPFHVSWIDILKQAVFLDWRTALLNGSFWSLCVEFRWYAVFPLMLSLWFYSPRAFAALAVAVVIAFVFTRARSLDGGVLLPFMLGIVAAECEIRRPALRRYAGVALAAFVLAGVLMEPFMTISTAFGNEVHVFFEQTNLGWQLAMFSLVVAVGGSAFLRRVFASRPLVWTGSISYSVYLIHEPVVAYIDAHVNQPWFAVLPFTIVASLVAGTGMWFAFERPWLSGPLRQSAVRRLSAISSTVLRFCGIPENIVFYRRGEMQRSPDAPLEAGRSAGLAVYDTVDVVRYAGVREASSR